MHVKGQELVGAHSIQSATQPRGIEAPGVSGGPRRGAWEMVEGKSPCLEDQEAAGYK